MMKMNWRSAAPRCAAAVFVLALFVAPSARGTTLAQLSRGQSVHGFRTVARFLDDAGAPMGARFVHEKTGFTYDVLFIHSVPQGFIWVRTFPTSDKGEPHTQEHLLLGKGNKGKYVSNLEGMALEESSAYTEQWHTCYHFNTIAGPDVFFTVLKDQIDALLHPDYSDEEIRREVCNFGVAENPKTHALRLEEKGTVYNEMVSTYERPWSGMERRVGQLVYGDAHPLSYESGGLPSAIRTMTPQDIRAFHANAYHLANMGMVGSFAPEISLDTVLARMDGVLNTLHDTRPAHVMTEADLPPPAAATTGTIAFVPYPDHNDRRPSPLVFSWPADRTLDTRERMLCDLFVECLAGDATTNFYKMFVDTRTRVMNIGARDVFGWVSDDEGHPISIGFSAIDPDAATHGTVESIRAHIVDEIKHLAALPDGSPELIAFDERVQSRVTETRRAQSKFVNTPPGFGFRSSGSGSDWMNRLNALTADGRFDVSVTMAAELNFVDSLLAGTNNFWKNYIAKWKLTDAPYAVVATPSDALVRKEADDRAARCAAEAERLKKEYHAATIEKAIEEYRAQYDRTSAQLDSVTRLVATPPFIDNPPMTLDDNIAMRTEIMPPMTHEDTARAGGDVAKRQDVQHVRMYTSTFENMTSATIGLSLPVADIPTKWHMYLSLLPSLLTDVGVIENGVPVRYDDMQERLRKEILGLSAYFDEASSSGGRTHLVIRASGNTIDESRRAIAWMENALLHSDWRPQNLPRLRDVVDQALGELRTTMQHSEESWVHNPAEAYRRQNDSIYLVTKSFLTRIHNIDRLRWLLKDAGTGADQFGTYMEELRNAPRESNRAGVLALLRLLQGDTAAQAKLPHALHGYMGDFTVLRKDAQALVADAAKDLEENCSGIPDETLAGDWEYLCQEMHRDLLMQPDTVLADLQALRARIARREMSYIFFVGSEKSRAALDGELRGLVAALDTGQDGELEAYMNDAGTPLGDRNKKALIAPRMSARVAGSPAPEFVGLVNPNTQSGVFLNSAPLAGYAAVTATSDDAAALERFLASKLFGGHGAHSVYMKTWAAGLAYSNGVGSSALTNRAMYYAERCPELPQTLKFVIDQLKSARLDTSLAEYAIAQVFTETRAADRFEVRGEAMAHQLALEGLSQDEVRKFREAILALRTQPDLAAKLFADMPAVYGSVMPGYDNTALDAKRGIYFVIGSEKQMQLYDAYLKSAVSPGATLYRLYPRDFWLTE